MQAEQARALITVAAMAAFADGRKSEQERTRFQEMAAQLGAEGLDPSAIVTNVLLKRADLASACAALATPELRALAYEFAVCMCDADGPATAEEQAFLGKLGGLAAGGLGKAVARGATGAALTFATTYALGHVAHRYYGGGRRLDRAAMQNMFGELKSQASTLYPRYADQVQRQSTEVNVPALLAGRGLP